MKKIKLSALMSVILAAAPGLASATSATFVESFDGTFSETVTISGTVENNSPNWSWRILPSSATALSGIALQTKNATLTNSNLVWSLTSTVPFLQGVMVNASPTGAAGLQPAISVAGTNITMTSTSAQSLTIPASGTTSGGTAVQGSVVLDLTLGFTGTATFGVAPNQFIYDSAGASLTTLESTAFSFLAPVITKLKTATPALQSNPQSSGTANRYQVLSDPAAKNVAGALATSLSNIKVSFPAATLPQSWTAPVAVTVSLR